jgi:hypothetical protein
VAGGPGFEPGLTESESAILPLNHPPPDGTRSSVGWTYPRRGAGLEIDHKEIARRNTQALERDKFDYHLATPLLATRGPLRSKVSSDSMWAFSSIRTPSEDFIELKLRQWLIQSVPCSSERMPKKESSIGLGCPSGHKSVPPLSAQPTLPDFFEARPSQPVAGALDFPAQFRRL